MPVLCLLCPCYARYARIRPTMPIICLLSLLCLFLTTGNLFNLGTSIAITLSETQKVLPTPVGRKYSIGSSLLTSSLSMILTHLPFSIAPLAVAPPLTFPLFPPLSPRSAPGRCFRTWVLITYQFFHLSLFLRSFVATNVPLSSIFRVLAAMTLPPTLTLTVLLQRNTRLFPFSLLLLSVLLRH